MGWIKSLLHAEPNIALFACLAAGYAIGKVKIWKIRLGGVAGTLLAALLVGQTGVQISPEVKDLGFALFIFALGYTGGPQFFANLNRKGLKYAIFPVIEIVGVLAVVAAAVVFFGFDRGTAAGLLAGGATESAVVGTASDAIGNLRLPADQIKALQGNIATAYTISYLVGMLTSVIFASQIAPLLMRVNLREEGAKLWATLGGGGGHGMGEGKAHAAPNMVGRIHRVEFADDRTVAELEEELGHGAAIDQIRRDGVQLTVEPDTILRRGDEVLLIGERAALLCGDVVIGPELADTDGFDVDLDTHDVVFSHRKYSNQTLSALREQLPPAERRGVFLTGITRMENPMPAQDGTPLQVGDVLHMTGRKTDLHRVAKRVGYSIDPGVKADFIYLGLGIILGILLGRVTVHIGGVPLEMGTGGGALISGLIFGWLRAKRPTFGAFHPAAVHVTKDFGLAVFIAAVGLGAGPQVLTVLKKYGVVLPIFSVLVSAVPAVIAMYVGWKILKLPAPLTLGAIAGKQCSTPTLTAVQQAVGNSTPLISYTIVYALANVVLPMLGPIVVALAGALGATP